MKAIYLRVSTQEQSFDSQRHEIELLFKARGWVNPLVYEEKESGAKEDRKELQRLLYDAQKGKFDTLVIYKLDRLGRSLKQVIETLDLLQHYRVSVISLKENIDLSTAQGRLLTHLISAFAEFERDLIRGRVKDGIKAAKAKGKPLGRPRKGDPSLIEKLRAEGKSYRAIAKQLGISVGAVQTKINLSR